MKASIIIFIGVAISGCTMQAWYEGGKYSAEHQCNKYPQDAREQCLENINTMSYEEYEKGLSK